MSKFQNFASQAAQSLKKAFHYLFAYDEDRLTLRGDSLAVNLAKLQLAFLKRQYLLVTLNDGSWWVGKITKWISPSRFVFSDADNKIFYLLDINDILTVELP